MAYCEWDELMCRNYLRWDENSYTCKERFLPIIKLTRVESHDGVQRIRLEYYKNHNTRRESFLLSEYLDAGLSDEEFLHEIDARMSIDRWFVMPECFTGERVDPLSLPSGYIEFMGWTDRKLRSFAVETAGYGAVYQDNAGRRISTETVFNICISTDALETGTWYELCFSYHLGARVFLRRFDRYHKNQMSLVLTATQEGWSFGLSAYDSRFDPLLRDVYEVRYAPSGKGFLFRIKRMEVDRIWFKAAWLKSEGLDQDLCRQALRHWLE